mmetsp:Transcript_46544/g.113364  ORF Transcript_46544/g.113364 Transcript_46544/m.113364 type:complete len:374 (-) Transcript_46544:649-1770(-)
MGIFNRKKKKEGKGVLPSIRPLTSYQGNDEAQQNDSGGGSGSALHGKDVAARSAVASSSSVSSRPSEQHRSSETTRIVKVVGGYKHVTEVSHNEKGEKTEQTKVSKLTDEEIEELGKNDHSINSNKKNEAKSLLADIAGGSLSSPVVASGHQGTTMPVTASSMDQYFGGSPAQPSPSPPVVSTPSPRKFPLPSSSTNPAGAVVEAPDRTYEDHLTQIETTRDLVKKFISEIWNRGEIEMIPYVCHPSLRFNGHVGMDRVGLDGFARMVSTVRDALADYHCEIHSMVVEYNKAFCRLRFTGKHTGNLLGFPPTGKMVAWMGASEFTCKNGKILKVWELGDLKDLEQQLKSADGSTGSTSNNKVAQRQRPSTDDG